MKLIEDLSSVLFDVDAISRRVAELGSQIERDYLGKNLTVIAVLHGSLPFLADLIRRVNLPLRLHAVAASSYRGETASSGSVKVELGDAPSLRDEHVLLIDDILDTGRTLEALQMRLQIENPPLSLRSCVLLDKPSARFVKSSRADYVGFEVGDEFVVGYGLDYQGRYRNLPCIGVLKPTAFARVRVRARVCAREAKNTLDAAAAES